MGVKNNMLGIIGGTSLLEFTFAEWKKKVVHTPYGSSHLLITSDIALLMRHQNQRAPHRINYHAHIAALAISGVDRIIGFGSTGSLKTSIKPGSLVIPDDYFNLSFSPTVFNHTIGHILPEFSPFLIKQLSDVIPDAHLGGTYIQTNGPRIETAAEIRWMSEVADIVGMTIASEATISRELNIPFAAICSVDNFANGLSSELVTYDQIVSNSRLYKERTEQVLGTIFEQCV
jgi:5'-methylthioadenosine phosphorylase